MSLKGKIELVGLTDVGRKRSHNEDTIGSDPSLGVAILADGMGGYRAGEVASAIAVKLIMDELGKGLGKLRAGEIDDETGFSRETLLIKTAIEKANEAIYQTAQSQPQCHGMGTTVVTAAFYDDRVTIAHVGDSRLYRMREGLFEQVTSDHSLRQELVDKGFYTPEEARSSLNKNLVTRAIGIEMTVNPDLQEDVVKPGDVYLMCSDGLSDPVSDEVMQDILARHMDDLPAAARSLVEQANENGGKDNISVILVRSLAALGVRRRWYSRLIDWF